MMEKMISLDDYAKGLVKLRKIKCGRNERELIFLEPVYGDRPETNSQYTVISESNDFGGISVSTLNFLGFGETSSTGGVYLTEKMQKQMYQYLRSKFENQ